jgi:hypothetical protein
MSATQPHGGAVLRTLAGGVFGVEVGPLLPGPMGEPAGGAVRWVARAGRPAVEEGDEAAAWRLVAGGASRALVEGLDAWLVNGRRVCLRPHREDAVSDIPSTLGVLRQFGARGLEVLVAPADFITGSMLRHVADHYVRIVGTFAGQAGVAGFLLEDVTAVGEGASACLVGRGLVPERVWAEVSGLVKGCTLVGSGEGWIERLRAVGVA